MLIVLLRNILDYYLSLYTIIHVFGADVNPCIFDIFILVHNIYMRERSRDFWGHPLINNDSYNHYKIKDTLPNSPGFTCQVLILKYSWWLLKYSLSKSSLVFTYLYFLFVSCRFSYYFQAQMMIFFYNDINKLHPTFRTILKYCISYCFPYTFYFLNELRQSSFMLKQPKIHLVSSLEPF